MWQLQQRWKERSMVPCGCTGFNGSDDLIPIHRCSFCTLDNDVESVFDYPSTFSQWQIIFCFLMTQAITHIWSMFMMGWGPFTNTNPSSCFIFFNFLVFLFTFLYISCFLFRYFFCSILKLEGGHVVKTISHFKGYLKFFKTIHGFERMFIGLIRTLLQDPKNVHGVNIFTRLKNIHSFKKLSQG
jgi:hypothetical protein